MVLIMRPEKRRQCLAEIQSKMKVKVQLMSDEGCAPCLEPAARCSLELLVHYRGPESPRQALPNED